MTAMKKNNAKKSPAPATTTKKPAKKKAAAPAAASKPVSAPALTPRVAAERPATPVAPTEPAVVKSVAPAAVQTRIIAKVDVGYGNTLFVRGDGPGLSWSQGVPMECVAADQWEFTIGEAARPVSFKVLINDMTWCTGPDSVAASGSTTTITPEFA